MSSTSAARRPATRILCLFLGGLDRYTGFAGHQHGRAPGAVRRCSGRGQTRLCPLGSTCRSAMRHRWGQSASDPHKTLFRRGSDGIKRGAFSATKSTRVSSRAAGCSDRSEVRVAAWGCRGGSTRQGVFTWPACPCDRCWKRVSISDTRPASGTRRWPRSSSANVTRSTSSTSRSRCPCSWRRRCSCSNVVADGGTRAVRRHQARRARRDRRPRRPAAACPTSTSAGWAAC